MRAPIILLAAVLIAAVPARAEPMTFEGIVTPSQTAVLSSRLDGVVVEVLFAGGEKVEAGQPLIRLDPIDAELALAAADAALAEARATLQGTADDLARKRELNRKGVTPDALVTPSRTAHLAARAAVARAEADRRRAALDLERAVIRAPISGYVSEPQVAIGAFLEAEAAPPLATIVALDPAVVAYRAPYADRLAALEASGAGTVEGLLARIRLTVQLPDGRMLDGTATPRGASPVVDPETGAFTVWAAFDNPDALLRPGMKVSVRSVITDGKE